MSVHDDPQESLVPSPEPGAPDLTSPPTALPIWSVAEQEADAAAETAGVMSAHQGDPGEPGPATYRLLRMLGRGGMGEVWEAEQTSLGRRVAVKRLRDDAPETHLQRLARERAFRLEAHVAASLEHPNILPVHDLGADAEGDPLIAMKLVEGKPWNLLIREDWQELVEEDFFARHIPILMAMTQAVAFAHSRGIVHRDLKPAQVLVGAFGEVLLADWGLAVRLEDGGPLERFASAREDWGVPTPVSASNPAGTPSMMAPEQTRRDGVGIGMWTDVYLLGGTLYLLLAGSFPHRAASAREAIANAREGIIEPPSRRAPGRRIPRDLEELCLAALAKEPADRLPSAAEFHLRLEAHLRGTARRARSVELTDAAQVRLAGGSLDYTSYTEVIASLDEARRQWPDNPAWAPVHALAREGLSREALRSGDLALARVQAETLVQSGAEGAMLLDEVAREQRRVAGRRRLFRAAAALAFLLTGVVAVSSTYFVVTLQRANQATTEQRDRALAAETLAARRAAEAERNLATAVGQSREGTKLIGFLLDDVKAALDEELVPERGVAAKDANAIAHAIAGRIITPVKEYYDSIDFSAWPIDEQQFLVEQKIAAANRFYQLRRLDEAIEMTSGTLPMAIAAFGSEHPLIGTLHTNLGRFLERNGDWGGAETQYKISLAALEASPETLPHHLALAQANLSAFLSNQNKFEPAIVLARKARENYLRSYPEDHELVLRMDQSLAILLHQTGQTRAAVEQFRRTIAISEASGKSSRSAVAIWTVNFAFLLNKGGRTSEALAFARKGLELVEKQFGPTHENYYAAIGILGSAQFATRMYIEAEDNVRKQLAFHEQRRGAASPDADRTRSSLAAILSAQDRHAEALELLRTSIANAEARAGRDNEGLLPLLQNLATAQEGIGDDDGAAATLDRCTDIARRRFGDDDPRVAQQILLQSTRSREVGRYEDARAQAAEAVRIFEAAPQSSSETLRAARMSLARASFLLGKREEAIESVRSIREAAVADVGPDDDEPWLIASLLVNMLSDAARHDEAVPLARAVLERAERTRDAGDLRLLDQRTLLTSALIAAGQVAEALTLARQALAAEEARPQPQPVSVAAARENLARALAASALSAARVPDGSAAARTFASEALALSDSAPKSRPAPAAARARKAMLLHLVGRTDEARRIAQTVASDPGGPGLDGWQLDMWRDVLRRLSLSS